MSKNTFKKHVDLLDGEDKKHYVFIKGFNIFIFQYFNMIMLYIVEGIIFCCYRLPAFRTEEILKCDMNDYFDINGKQMIKMAKTDQYVIFPNYERKINHSS